MNEKLFQVGIKGIIQKDNAILLLVSQYDSTDQPLYDLPGGRIHQNETTTNETLTRELTEELPGVTNIKIQELIGAAVMPKNFPSGIGWLLLFYTVDATLPKTIKLTAEHTRFEWIDAARLEQIFHDQNRSEEFHQELYDICRQAITSKQKSRVSTVNATI